MTVAAPSCQLPTIQNQLHPSQLTVLPLPKSTTSLYHLKGNYVNNSNFYFIPTMSFSRHPTWAHHSHDPLLQSSNPHPSKSIQTQFSSNMGDTRVDTISRLAQWRVDNFGPCTYKKSDPFRIGIWNWHFSIEKNRYLYVRLFPELSKLSKEQPPLARFILRVSGPGVNRKPYVSQVQDRLLRGSEDFVCHIDYNLPGRFVIDVEFLDLKIYAMNGGETTSIWPSNELNQSIATHSALKCLSRLLHERIHADVTINTADGNIKAHKAILAASSPVFHSMFLHDLKENRSSTVDIEDMSFESCTTFLGYLYGDLKPDEFWKQRVALLGAANKYGITNLKDACEESLLEDINSENVLERLQEAWLYQLHKLKKGCFIYLFEFGKIYDVKDEINCFFKTADRDLMLDMFQEVISIWKPL